MTNELKSKIAVMLNDAYATLNESDQNRIAHANLFERRLNESPVSITIKNTTINAHVLSVAIKSAVNEQHEEVVRDGVAYEKSKVNMFSIVVADGDAKFAVESYDCYESIDSEADDIVENKTYAYSTLDELRNGMWYPVSI
jgi:hypothetical protein